MKYLLVLPIALVAGVLLSSYDEEYHRLIRWFYTVFTSGDIFFKYPPKYFHFPSNGAVTAFSAYAGVFTFFEFRKPLKRDVLYTGVAVIMFFATTASICAFASYSDLVSCTACKNGRMMLHYESIDYDLILYACLVTSLFTYCYLKLSNDKAREIQQTELIAAAADRKIK